MISIIIPTHEREAKLDRLLQSIYQQDMAIDHFEVLVISNLHSTKAKNIVEKIFKKNIFYHSVGKIGVNRARNLGIQKSNGEILVFLDDDCFLLEMQYLKNIREAHLDFPRATAIGGRYIPVPSGNRLSIAYHSICDRWLTNTIIEDNLCANLLGGNVSYKRSHLIPNFYFQETIVFGGAETELHQRLLAADHELRLLESIPVQHDLKISFIDFVRKAFLQGLNERRSEFYSAGKRTFGIKRQTSPVLPSIVLLYTLIFKFIFQWGRSYAEIERKNYSIWRIILNLLVGKIIHGLDRIRPKVFFLEFCASLKAIKEIHNSAKMKSSPEK